MADHWWERASVRARTTAAAVLVVAIALVVAAVVLVVMVRGSLRQGVENSAEQRAATLADEIEGSGLPSADQDDDLDEFDDADDPDDVVWQVSAADGTVVRASQEIGTRLPIDDTDEVRLPGGDHAYVVATEDATVDDQEYVVAVASSLEEVADSSSALVPLLLVGVPVLLLLVGGTTWIVVSRALAPVERIRREVEQVTGDQLDRRVPEPQSHDEIRSLAQTMNRMLGRLEGARDRQQQFVADASHELRSPLASIRQTAEVARAHPGALPEGELAEAVLDESDRMQRLVEQLLLLTRTDAGVAPAREDVDVDDLALTEVKRVDRPGLTVDTSGVGPGRVRGDRTLLGQVTRNLVENAVRHAAGTVAISVREDADGVELAVEDDGPGIPAPQRERVFERFVRLDEARARDAGGSGLGLAIVQAIVAAHGGTVAVSSSRLGGARFVVRLPAPASA